MRFFKRCWQTLSQALAAFRRKRMFVFATLAAGICFLLGFLISFELPKLRAYLLVKIEEASRDHLPVRVLPGKIEISFLPLGATLNHVRILPKKETEAILERASIERLRVTLSPWILLSGRLRLSDVLIQGAEITATIPPSEKKSGSPLEGAFDLLNQIPMNRLELVDVSLNLRLSNPDLSVNVNQLNLVAEKQLRGSLGLDLNTVTAKVTDLDSKTSVRVDAEAHLSASREEISIEDLRVRRGDSFISAKGDLSGNVEALKFEQIVLDTETELHLESMRNWAVKRFDSMKKVPALKGRAFASAKIEKRKNEKMKATFKARTEGLGVMKMLFDRLEANGTLEEDLVKIPAIRLENAAGLIAVDQFQVGTVEPFALSGQLKTANLQLHNLLKTLGVGEIPVWAQATGDIPCTGKFNPFLIECKGSLKASDILVRDSMKSKGTIVAVRNLAANGAVAIDAEKVSYQADLATPLSKGTSDGVVAYDEGFKINYETDRLDLKDIANLADLRLEGAGKIKGSTEGDSDAATLALEIDGTDMWFEDFWLGNPKALVSYREGVLGFANLSGYYTVSRYSGDVKVDLSKKILNVTARAPFFDARDLMKVFSRRVKLPFPVTGTGQMNVKASGPLALSQLSYDLKSSLFKGSVAGETFDQIHFDVKSVEGEVKTERVDLLRGPSIVTLSGVGHPDGTIKTLIQGRGLKVEDSSTVASSGLAVSGNVDFDMTMVGPVLAPDTDMQGKLTNTSVGDQGMPDSDFKLKFRSNAIEGAGNLLGNVVKTSFTIPFDSQSPFALKLSTQDWNYAPVFAAFAGSSGRKDYEGRLTSNIDLQAPSGGFWNSSGTIKVDKFSLSRGALALRSNDPLNMSMKNGQLRVDKFDLAGDNIYLRVNESPNPVNKIDLQVNGKIDLTLVAILTPFLDDLRGILSFAFNLRAGPAQTELLGSAYIDKAFVKIPGFPHPLENIQADLLFNQRKILFNTIKAELGGGRVNGTGGMELKGYKNYPVNLAGTFDKVTFNIPDKVRTTGSGTLSFTGNWFPFVLKADYEIKEGLATKELGGDSTESDGIRRDFFLPELLLAESFTPVVLDVNIGFQRGIAVKNELLEGRVLGTLSVKGKPNKPSILGSITTDRETNIFVKDTPFEVMSSNIQFLDPNELNPKLFISARARKNEYDITLLIQGTASNPQLAFTSVPPLPEKDIISLLAIGATDTQLSTTVKSGEQGSNSALNVGSGVIRKNPVTNLIKDSIGFDVQFSPGFDETGNSAVQKIIVSRQFNQRFDVTASRSIGGKTQETQARARYRLNERVSVIGSWLGRDYTESVNTTQTQVQNPNAFGLDLEYKFEFK